MLFLAFFFIHSKSLISLFTVLNVKCVLIIWHLTVFFSYFAFQSLLETHDSVASQTCDSPPPSPCDCVDHELEEGHKHNLHPQPDAVRMVGIRKVAGEHLVGVIQT